MADNKSLSDVIQTLREEGGLTREKDNNSIKSLREALVSGGLQAKEDRREDVAREEKIIDLLAGLDSSSKSIPKDDTKFTDGLLGLVALKAIIAGVAAVGAALAGLRGWEAGALKAIKDIKILPDTVFNAMIRLRNAAYGMFGLTPKGLLRRNALGQFEKAPPITTQIRMRMNAIRLRVLRLFGIGPDGKLLTLTDKDGLFKKNIIGRVTTSISRLLQPLLSVTRGVTLFAAGLGKPIFAFFDGLGSTIKGQAGGIVKRFASILKPIGFFISLFDGWKAYQGSEEEKDLLRLSDGVAGFFGSFLGAPFDLLKAGLNWVFDKIFEVKRDEKGNVTSEGWASWASEKMKQFSFVKLVQGFVKAPFQLLSASIDWIKKLLDDPTKALEEMWSGLKGVLGLKESEGFVDLLFKPYNLAINWVMDKFGWSDPGGEQFDLKNYIMDVWHDVVDGVTSGFRKFGNWLMSIPSRIKLVALDAIDSILPDWAKDWFDMDKERADIRRDLDAMRRAEELASKGRTIAETYTPTYNEEQMMAAAYGTAGPSGYGGFSIPAPSTSNLLDVEAQRRSYMDAAGLLPNVTIAPSSNSVEVKPTNISQKTNFFGASTVGSKGRNKPRTQRLSIDDN